MYATHTLPRPQSHMNKHPHKIELAILPSEDYKRFLERIVYDYPGVSDNIAYHFSYLEYLYQILHELPLRGYRVLNGLRIKTIIVEIASCAEVLLYDAITNLSVRDSWGGKYSMGLERVGFAPLLKHALNFGVVEKGLHGRLAKLFTLRHKIHLTHRRRDPYEFTEALLRESERTLEDLLRHFISKRQREISTAYRKRVTKADLVLPWKRV